MGKIFPTAWKVALTPGRRLQLIAVADIGYFAAQAFIQPEKYNHRGIGLAGDELSYEEADRIFKEKIGYSMPLTYEFIIRILLWRVADVGAMFRWFERHGYGIDIKKLREEHPGLLNFGDFLETQGKFELKKNV
jgi:hypothetical protein